MVTQIDPKEQLAIKKAQALLSRNDADAARSVLIDYASSNSISDPAKYLLSLCHAVLGDFREASVHIPALCRSQPGNIEHHKLAGSIYHGLQDYESAISSFRKALSIDDRDIQTLSNIAGSLQQLQRYDEAERYYNNSLSLRPDQPDALTNFGLMSQANGKVDEAIALHKKALQLAPNHINACYNLAYALSEKGDMSTSLDLYEKVITAAPGHVRALCDIAYVLNKIKKPDSALDYLTRAVELAPEDEHALLSKAITHKKLGDIDEASACYSKVLSINPGNEKARYHLEMMNGKNSFSQSPVSYVQELFDGYAETFDDELVNKLEYRVPEQIADIVRRFSGHSKRHSMLDLGCGTGLVGVHLQDIADNMTGVDIAPKMIKKAARRGLYDELITSGIEAYFDTHEHRPSLVTSADVFIYIGDIENIFSEVFRVLEDHGLFIFSIEDTDEDERFMLKESGRFGHNQRFIETLSADTGFDIIECKETIVRLESGEPIKGHIYLLQKP